MSAHYKRKPTHRPKGPKNPRAVKLVQIQEALSPRRTSRKAYKFCPHCGEKL